MPESYWTAWLGGVCGLRPSDLGDLTPWQLEECWMYADPMRVKRG